MESKISNLKQFARVGKIFPKELIKAVESKAMENSMSGSINPSKLLDK